MTTPNVSSSVYSTVITQTTQVQKEESERLTCRLSPLYVKPTWTTVILYGSYTVHIKMFLTVLNI